MWLIYICEYYTVINKAMALFGLNMIVLVVQVEVIELL